ncbi:hypothetical protein L3X38_032321 [Prunus dulcis]|uniref:Uncharacterized protein n=1 Tax=Prunus dulcis TaxID=3755 RepID=A0AAD4VDS9_PRUDU|nr:hypothetical protein L3X38_032321 [Prunus dulcis]
MFVFLRHLGNTSAEALHFCLEIDIYRSFLSGGTPVGGMGSENGSLEPSFDVGLCASRCGRDTCPWRLGSAVENFISRELRQMVGTSEECLPSAGEEGMSALVLVVLMMDLLG